MQKLTYKTIDQPFFHEIPKIKGSRFFVTFFPIHSKEEIDQHLEAMRKQYYDATHNCYAWRLGVQAHQDLFWNRNISSKSERANDDGEPTNTAGKPILSVLAGEELFNVLAVVTRYFGGTLLGVGGLIQAYSATTKAWAQALPIIAKEIKRTIKLTYNYDQLATMQYLINKFDAQVLQDHYSEKIEQNIAVNLAREAALIKELIDKQIPFAKEW